jgi:small GTP-binding protein domain
MATNNVPAKPKPTLNYTRNKLKDWDYDIGFKYVLIGDTKCGKTCLTKRYCENTFPETFTSTVGMELGVKNLDINSQRIRITFWDLGGQEKFRVVSRQLYRNSTVIILCYDITSKISFNKMIEIHEDIVTHYGQGSLFIVAGLKSDLEEERKVDFVYAKEWAASRGYPHFECSAKNNENIDNIFLELTEHCLSLI